MKKEYDKPVIAFFLIDERDIIQTSDYINYNDLSNDLSLN